LAATISAAADRDLGATVLPNTSGLLVRVIGTSAHAVQMRLRAILEVLART
jgi:hypothetical protein